MKFQRISCIGLSLIGLSQALPAQTYPAKPIHIIVKWGKAVKESGAKADWRLFQERKT